MTGETHINPKMTLEELIRLALTNAGKPQEFIEGYITSERATGALRDYCPPWVEAAAYKVWLRRLETAKK